ncbi:MAG: hypothetical protein FJ303_25575 [Planctomycetes bacterium]|nr:hypothetical protein [Planctomycetota bacterium]
MVSASGENKIGLLLSPLTTRHSPGVPEYILSFFVASIGTSLPELVVELTAISKGQNEIAIGDALGSCLVDGSLSIAIGPLLFPTEVTMSLVVRGAAIAASTMVLIVLLVGLRGKLDRLAGAALLGAYVAAYFVFLA